MANCDRRGPLTRSGTSQTGRDLAELDPGFFRLDERGLADQILYARDLAREIAYYGPDNARDGDWEPFFAADIAATLATLARLPVAAFRAAFLDADEFLREGAAPTEAELADYFNLVFHMPVALFGELAQAHALIPRDHAMHGTLTAMIAQDLTGPLSDLVAFHKGAEGGGLPFDPAETAPAAADYGTGIAPDARPRLSDTVAGPVFTGAVLVARDITGPSMAALGAADWADFCAGIAGDAAPYQAATLREQVFDALTYNLLSRQLERCYQAIERIARAAEAALEQAVEDGGAHGAHYGLFLSFLSMLEPARDSLNDFTARHLDFYLSDILRMAPRPPVPDTVHLQFELARGIEARDLPAGTGLRAGKDALGQPVSYASSDTIVVNRAEVVERRAVRLHEVDSGGDAAQTLFAAPMADSGDGLGGDLPAGANGWPAFGPLPHAGSGGEAAAPFGRAGFAMADRRLFLREGQRSILMGFLLDGPVTAPVLAKMQARLTGPEGWVSQPAWLFANPAFLPNLVMALVTLDGDQPAVVPFDPALHAEDNGGGYDAGLPVAELTFDFAQADDATAKGFATLRSARIQSAHLLVAAAELRSLSVQTQDGSADPSRPFAAFGAEPKAGSSLIVGSAEIFSKPLSVLTLRPRWEEVYLDSMTFRDLTASSYALNVDYLVKGKWQNAGATLDPQWGNTLTPVLNLPGIISAGATAAMTEDDPAYDFKARAGFVRLGLNTDFGHKAYVGEFTRAMIAKANNTTLAEHGSYDYATDADGDKVPNLPYTPVITELAADYITTPDAPEQLLQVAPFGQAQRSAAGARLLPALDYEAALYLGVKDLEVPARLTLHVQVANGTGDPLLELPKLDIRYLCGDDWCPFDAQAVDDKTGNFAASAILGLVMPEAADTEHGLMPGGLHWLRIAAPENAGAINNLLSVDAQAVRAGFVEAGNDPDFLATPLPAGTISKLGVPDPAIRKIRQPYASHGGRPQESDAAFRRRASERLRHKDRAATLWDYERLVLEAAPELYRVKCLNHTEFMRSGGKIVTDNEVSPGGVVVVSVPWTTGRPHLDPLRPYTDQATLKKLRDLLEPRVSPFVRLEVANPKFEEVRIVCKVAFRKGYDDAAFYLDELKAAVTGHLAPWSSESGADITFGGTLRKSSVIDFVEELPYVDFLEDFEMHHRPNPETDAWTPADMERIQAKTARSILVSARDHIVEELT